MTATLRNFKREKGVYASEFFPGHVDKFDFCIVTQSPFYLKERWSVCIYIVGKKHYSRSMLLVEKNQVVSEVVLICS